MSIKIKIKLEMMRERIQNSFYFTKHILYSHLYFIKLFTYAL